MGQKAGQFAATRGYLDLPINSGFIGSQTTHNAAIIKIFLFQQSQRNPKKICLFATFEYSDRALNGVPKFHIILQRIQL